MDLAEYQARQAVREARLVYETAVRRLDTVASVKAARAVDAAEHALVTLRMKRKDERRNSNHSEHHP